jgi:exonuclease SbcD
MRFIHCSDIHLGRRPVGGVGDYSQKRFEDYFTAFEQVIDRAVLEKVDALLIAGDLFDRRELSPEILHRTEKLLHTLKDKNIEVVAIEGNHDNISSLKEYESWLIYLEKKELLTRPCYSVTRDDDKDILEYEFVSTQICGVEVFGLGYPGSLVEPVIEAFADYLKTSGKNSVVTLIHTAQSGGDFLPGLVDEKTVLLLQDRVEYLAAGHFHSYSVFPKENPFMFIPGSTEYWDLGEKVGAKGMILYDTETKKHEFIPTTPRNKIHLRVEATDTLNLYEQFEDGLKKTTIVDDEDILIAEVFDKVGEGVDFERLRQIVDENASPLKFEIVVKKRKSSGGSNRRKEGESLKSVEERIIGSWDLFSDYKKEVTTTLNTLKESYGSGDTDLFSHSFDELLNHIVEAE